MRLFIATPVTCPIYYKIKQDLMPFVSGKWVEGYNLHITHLFIGEDDPKKYQKLKLDIPKEKIKVDSLGMFGRKILYLKPNSKHINSINDQLSKILNLDTDFKPHITICRVKEIKDKEGLEAKINSYKFDFEVDFELYLYQSILTNKGPIYKKIYKFS